MKAVLYTPDMEPITIIELSESAMRYLRKEGHCTLAVSEPVSFLAPPPNDWTIHLRDVRIIAEPLKRFTGTWDDVGMLLITRDEENALLLKAAFLPGQYGAVNQQRKEAFARGFMNALMSLGQERDD